MCKLSNFEFWRLLMLLRETARRNCYYLTFPRIMTGFVTWTGNIQYSSSCRWSSPNYGQNYSQNYLYFHCIKVLQWKCRCQLDLNIVKQVDRLINNLSSDIYIHKEYSRISCSLCSLRLRDIWLQNLTFRLILNTN